jgi:predicted acylesterase/phospholipase RssA
MNDRAVDPSRHDPVGHEPAETRRQLAHEDRLHAAALGLFGDETIAAEVGRLATFLEVPGGEILFRQDDPGDSAFVVLAGRLRAVRHDDGVDQLLSDAVRGETMGELGLITGEARSATVYAVRDSVVARIGGADFDALMRARPGAALPIMRLLASRLRRSTVGRGSAAATETTVAVLALGAADAPALAHALAAEIAAHRPVHLLEPGAGGARGDLEAVFEEDGPADRVHICVGEPGWTGWNATVLRHADEVLLVADADEDPAPGPVDAAVLAPRERGGPRVTLVLRHADGRAPSGTARWLEPRPGIRPLHIRAGDRSDVARVARWVTGRSVGLVLGGGGARGWSHLGALRALEELGVPIDLVGGTSQGALVGAAIADRRSAAAIRADALPLVGHLRDYTIPVVSILRGRLIGRTLEHIVRPGIGIEDLWLPYFAIATNLSRAERVVQTRGPVVEAMRASISLPMILPPVVRDGELLIDGGLLDNLPVGEMRRRIGTGSIIAIDLSPTTLPAPFDPLGPEVGGLRLLLDRLLPFRPRRRVPSIGEVAMRTMMAGSRHLRNRSGDADPRTLLLQPQLGDWSLMAFEHLDQILEIGYREMRDPIAAWWAAHELNVDGAVGPG